MNIGLCRISSVNQKDNTSLSNQKKMIEDYCKMYGIELSNIISECYSGTTSNRNGLNELKELVLRLVSYYSSFSNFLFM